MMGQSGEAGGFGELTYLLESGSTGLAARFSGAPVDYISRNSPAATLEDLMASADKIGGRKTASRS